MNPSQLLTYVIEPALTHMGRQFADPKAAVLLLATAAQESHCGEFLHQVNGPALGIFQIEPATHDMVWKWAARHTPTAVPPKQQDDALIYDLRYACTIARLLYYSWPNPLPASTSDACFTIYKECYNSANGAATAAEFNDNWTRYVEPALT